MHRSCWQLLTCTTPSLVCFAQNQVVRRAEAQLGEGKLLLGACVGSAAAGDQPSFFFEIDPSTDTFKNSRAVGGHLTLHIL